MGPGPPSLWRVCFLVRIACSPSGKTTKIKGAATEAYNLNFSGTVKFFLSPGILLIVGGSNNGRNTWASTAGICTMWVSTTCFPAQSITPDSSQVEYPVAFLLKCPPGQ